MNDNRDPLANSLSSLLSSLLSALYLYRTEKTILGILLGFVIYVASDVFLLGDIAWINTERLTWINSLILGLGLMYLPLIVKQFLSTEKEKEFDEEIERKFRIIERAKNEGLSKPEVDQLYLNLCKSVLLDQANLRPEALEESDKTDENLEN